MHICFIERKGEKEREKEGEKVRALASLQSFSVHAAVVWRLCAPPQCESWAECPILPKMYTRNMNCKLLTRGWRLHFQRTLPEQLAQLSVLEAVGSYDFSTCLTLATEAVGIIASLTKRRNRAHCFS